MVSQPYVDGITDTVTHDIATTLAAARNPRGQGSAGMAEQAWVGFTMSAGEWDIAAVFSGPDSEQLAAQWAAEGGGRVKAWPVITSRHDVVLAVSRMEDTPYARWTAQL